MAAPRIERRLRPTATGWALLALGAVLLAAAQLFGRVELLLLGGFLLLLPLAALGLRLLFRPRLSLRRSVFPRTIAAGDRVRVISELENHGLIALEPAAYLDLTPGAAIPGVSGVLPAIASRLNPRERRRRRRVAYSLDTMRRGVHELGPLYLENVDGLGLTRRVIRAGEPHEVEVWPRLHEISALEVPATRAGGEVEAGIAAAGDSDDVLTREYRHGDAMRRVHWRASARTDDLRVRQEEHHAEVSALVVLDTSPLPQEPEPEPATVFDIVDGPERLGTARADAPFEHAVSVAASVLVRMRELGYACELYETSAFADGEDDPRLGGMRSAAEEPLDGMMRHLMVAEPDRAGEPRPDAIGDLLRRAERIGRAPLVYVHRGLSGQRLHSLLALGDRGAPAIAVLVGRRGFDAQTQRDFARAGWSIVVMTTDSGDPWRNIRRFEDAGRVGGARA